jgi:hypothetical protein
MKKKWKKEKKKRNKTKQKERKKWFHAIDKTHVQKGIAGFFYK